MNNSTYPLLTKTCKVCGKKKPLSAFLLIDSKLGNQYGDICSSCRQQGINLEDNQHEDDDRRKSKSENTIDNKAKVYLDNKKIELNKRLSEDYHEERKEKGKEQSTFQEKNISKEKDTQFRRSLFDRKVTPPTQKTEQNKAKLFEKISNQQTDINKKAAAQKEHQLDTKKATEVDLSVPYFAPTQPGQIRYTSERFQRLRQFLGESSPIYQAMKKAGAPENKKAPNNATEKASEKLKDDSLLEFARKNFPGPSRKR